MRRLLLLVCALVLVDTMLFAVLTPLLPHFAQELGLSKARSGVLVGAYAAGALVGGLPGGVGAARLGARRAVLVGLTLMGLSSLGFAFAGGFWTLFAARFLQGGGSAFTWAGAFAWLLAAAPRSRRGELIGTAMGAAVFGALFGPVLGAAAALAGRAAVFTALAAVAVALGAWTLRLEPASPERPSADAVRRSLRNRLFVGGLGLMALPAFLFGVVSVLGPLRLSAAGWGAAAVASCRTASAAVARASMESSESCTGGDRGGSTPCRRRGSGFDAGPVRAPGPGRGSVTGRAGVARMQAPHRWIPVTVYGRGASKVRSYAM